MPQTTVESFRTALSWMNECLGNHEKCAKRASVDGAIKDASPCGTTEDTYLSKVLDIKVSLVNENNKFGQISGGSITMRGLLALFDTFKVGSTSSAYDANAVYDTWADENADQQDLRCLLIMKKKVKAHGKFHWSHVFFQGLIIEKVNEEGLNVLVYKRVGLVSTVLRIHDEVNYEEGEMRKRCIEDTVILI